MSEKLDAEIVRAFWADERPVDWPVTLPFPPKPEVLPLDWLQKRREELGLSVQKQEAQLRTSKQAETYQPTGAVSAHPGRHQRRLGCGRVRRGA